MAEVTCREWNGSTWGDGGDIEAILELAGVSGTSSECVYFGGWDGAAGEYTDRSEIYNGTTWSDATSMPRNMMGGGTGTSTTNAIIPCGINGGWDATSQILDGTTWSDGGESTSRGANYGTGGSSTDTIKMSGYKESTADETTAAETYNGTTWSAITALGIATRYGTGWGSGSTRAWYCGGINYMSPYGNPNPHIVNRTPEYWNGSSWATDTDTPDAGGTSGGKYNPQMNGGTSGNSGTQGAMIVGGWHYSGGSSSTKQSSCFEATW